MKRILPLIAVFLLSYQLKAQKDSIFFVNGDTLVGSVLKADDDQVIFSIKNGENHRTIYSEKNEINLVVLSNGQIISYSDRTRKVKRISPLQQKRLSNYTEDQHLKVFKLNATGLIFNTIEFGKEKLLQPNQSIEGYAGLILLGRHPFHEFGLNLRFGYKWILFKDYEKKPNHRLNPLDGFYVKPELLFSYIVINRPEESERYWDEHQSTIYGFALNIGYQIVSSKGFVLDAFVGYGAGTHHQNFHPDNRRDNRRTWNYNPPPLGERIHTAGIRLGFTY